MRTLRIGILICVAAVSVTVAQHAPSEKTAAEFEKRKTTVLAEAAQRHMRLGSWCRKMGLVRQGTAQFLRAKEVGAGENPGADYVVRLMRSLDDAFWRKNRENPSRRLLRQYDKKARDLAGRDRRDRFGLANWARKRKLTRQAQEVYESLLREHDGPIVFDDKGRIPLEDGTIPAEFAARFVQRTVDVNGERQVRDRFLEDLPGVGEVFEHRSDALVVQSRVGREHAEKLHGLLERLLPHLEEAVGGKPTRPLRVFVFKERKAFTDYLVAAGYGASQAAGLTDPAAFVALVCAEGRAPAIVQAIAMHELTHLFEYAVAPVVFPSWYAEAFAETYGGYGTFALEDGELRVGGPIAGYRVRALKDPEQPLFGLRELLETDAMHLMRAEPERAAVFYAQSWALLRFLRTAAGEEIADKLRLWEVRCRGAAVGARAGMPRTRDEQPASVLFERTFGAELDELEQRFRAWLETL